jgi:hypothetical protein
MKPWKQLDISQKALRVVGVGAGVGLSFVVLRGALNRLFPAPPPTIAHDPRNLPALYEVPDSNSPTGTRTVKWSPVPLAEEIAEKLQGVNVRTYPELAKTVLKLNPDQIKALYSYYNVYLSEDGETLDELFSGEWGDWSGYYKKAANRIKQYVK